MIMLTEFLLARIAEDEAAVPYRPEPTVSDDVLAQLEDAQHGYRPLKPGVMTVTTARVMADCEAKRRVVELAVSWSEHAERHATASDAVSAVLKTQAHTAETILRTLARAWADHPDYSEEWRTA